jgi:outer membrane protein assembly factor BamB
MLRVRRLTATGATIDASVALPASLAGAPLAHGNGVLIATADGLVAKFDPAAGKLVPGPSWRKAGLGADAACFLVPGRSADEFHATDGANGIQRWTWPDAGEKGWQASSTQGWETVGPFTCAPVIVGDAFVVADANGVSAYPAAAPGEPLRRWKDAKAVRQLLVHGQRAIALGATAMALDPSVEAPVWQTKPEPNRGDPVGVSARENRIYFTDADGQVTVLNAETGNAIVTVRPGRAGMFPADGQPAVPIGQGRVVLPLMDGTSLLLLVGE